MGKPARWLKSVLLGKKSSKSSGSKDKERAVNGKEVVVVSKIEESDVVSDLPSFGNATVYTSSVVETRNIEHEVVSDDEIQLPEVQVQPTDPPNAASVPDDSPSDSDKVQQEVAATNLQAAFRGYLARRAFWALKGIIRLQAVIRGHMVRRQAVATLCCVMGIVRLQALARGREIRRSDIGVEVHRKCRLNHQHLENKLHEDSVVEAHTYMRIKKLTANAFAQKLLASSPIIMPVHLDNDSSTLIWLENWSASCFWKPVPQPRKTSVRRTQKKFVSNSQIAEVKKTVRKVPVPNHDNPSATQTSFEFEKPKRSSFRKFSTSQSVEPPPPTENAQVDLEKVKRGLRKVHNPVVENSIQPQPAPEKEIEKPTLALKEPVKAFDEEKKDEMAKTVVEQPEELITHTHGPLETNEALDSSLINQIEESEDNVMAEEKEDVKEERTPKQKHKENSAGKENKKSGRKDSPVTTTQTSECQESSNGNQNSTPGIPSYMQATKSAKAKLRLQGSSSPKQQESEKATRRYSLPSSGNNARVTSDSPKPTRVSNSGGKTGKKTEKPSSREGNGKTTPVEWKR